MRYSRQAHFIGNEAQGKIINSTILIAGCGGIGSFAAHILGRAGFNLILVDRDVVEKSNLHRQFFTEADIGKPKASVLEKAVKKSNSSLKVSSSVSDICDSYMMAEKAHIVIDCMDNMESRLMLNDACRKLSRPLIYASAIQNEGVVFLANSTAKSPCVRCVFPQLPSHERTCEADGVMPTATSMAAVIASQMCIDFIVGRLPRNITYFKNSSTESIDVLPRKNCQCCSGNYEFLDNSRNISRICGGIHIYSQCDVEKASEIMAKNSEFSITARGSNFIIFNYLLPRKKAEFILFQNRMIAKNANEAEALAILAKLGGKRI